MMQPLFRRNRDISAVLRFLPLVLVVIAVFLTFSVQDSDAETTDDADPVYGQSSGFVSGRDEYWPFPESEILSNPSLTQNPGWLK